MTRLIVGVASLDEARTAVHAGVDGVEIANPMLLPGVQAVVDRKASIGFILPPGEHADDGAPLRAGLAEADYLVQPLRRADDAASICGRVAQEAGPLRLHVAIGDDEPVPAAILALAAGAGFVAARLDTRDARLLDRLPISRVQRFTAACASAGLDSGLCGRLEAPDVPRLLELDPADLIFAARGARPLDAGSLARLRALMPVQPASSSGSARFTQAADRVFLHDLVLPVFVGAYGHEEHARQRVRFSVDVDVAQIGHAAADMRDIFSYDLILDGIRLLTASAHWPVIEGLAERLAGRLLRHPRAMRVTVRIEKLDVAPCIVGVEVVRAKSGASDGL